MAHNSQVRNGSYPMFRLIHVETGFCHPDFSGKQPQSMFETRKLTSDPSLHDQRQIIHEPPSKLILYGAKMQAIILLAPHRSTVFCSNQNEIIQKCSGIVPSTSKVSLFLFFGLYCKNNLSLVLFAGSMATERGKWLNHFGKKISIRSNESIPGLGSFFQQMSTTTSWLRPARILKHLDDHQDLQKKRCNPAPRRNRGKVAYF